WRTFPSSHRVLKAQMYLDAQTFATSKPTIALHGLSQCTVDDKVCAGDTARHRARQEDHTCSHLLRRAHTPGRVQRHRRLIELGHAMFDVMPDAAFEISVARRNRVDADAFDDQLVAEPLGVMNKRRLDGAVRAGSEIDLEARNA